jgi:hypothetical protein
MAFDISNFVIDRVVRGIAVAQGDNDKLGLKKGDVLFSINQIQEPSLNCASESTDAVDALNTPIATFYRAKSAEFSANNALFDMNLMATQVGTTKKTASTGAKITVPCFQTIDVTDGTSYTLSHTPKANVTPKVYVLNGDGTLGEKVEIASSAAGKSIAVAGTTVTIVNGDGGYAAGDQIFFMYEYEADGSEGNGAVEVVNSATNFPVGCKFIMEILGCDVCDQTNLIYAYLVFNNAKLSPDFDWTISTDSNHPFSMKAMQDLSLTHRSIAA